MNRRGIYSMITTFFLVATIVFVVIGLIYFSQFTTSQEAAVFREVEIYEKANDIRANILDCYGGLTAAKVADKALATDCAGRFLEGDRPLVRGFSIEVLKFLSCEEASAQIGDMDNCSSRFIYYLDIADRSARCLGKMVICS